MFSHRFLSALVFRLHQGMAESNSHKVHRAPQAGPKYSKKRAKQQGRDESLKGKNPKVQPAWSSVSVVTAPCSVVGRLQAFTYSSSRGALRSKQRVLDREHHRHHVPQVDRAAQSPPPFLVAVVGATLLRAHAATTSEVMNRRLRFAGPAGVGKSSVVRSLVKHYTKQTLSDVRGPITIVTSKTRRITILEVCCSGRVFAFRCWR